MVIIDNASKYRYTEYGQFIRILNKIRTDHAKAKKEEAICKK